MNVEITVIIMEPLIIEDEHWKVLDVLLNYNCLLPHKFATWGNDDDFVDENKLPIIYNHYVNVNKGVPDGSFEEIDGEIVL